VELSLILFGANIKMTTKKEYTRKKRIGYLAIVALCLCLIVPFVQIPTAKATTTYSYSFTGPFSEATSGIVFNSDGTPASCRITAYDTGSPYPISFNITGTMPGNADNYIYNTTSTPQYFSFDITDNGTGKTIHREYWLTYLQGNTTFNLFFPRFSNYQTYILSFLDQVGVLNTYPYVSFQRTNTTGYLDVSRQISDSQKIVSTDLEIGYRYHISFTDGTTIINYGDITTTATAGIQLIIRGVDFPKASLLLSDFVHAYAIRDFLNPLGAITTRYEDTSANTNSVTITITSEATSVIVYTNTYLTNNNFTDVWSSAVNATNYKVTITIDHATFGTLTFRQFLIAENLNATSPFSLSFLGDIGISTAWVIPALLIIFVAGCFSELTSEAAAIITVIVAIILVWMGWINISSGALVAALSLSVMAGIVSVKRRFG
jgi:hypothetical protein